VRPSLAELGLYRTLAEFVKATRLPEHVIYKWIRENFIRKVQYEGRWYYSKRQLARMFLWCHEQIPFFAEFLSQDFGFPVIFEDGRYKRWYPDE
jgi:hypothetical protein